MEEKTLLELKALLWSFFPVAWMGHLGLGLTYGLMGPAQPYLASQVGVGHQAISLLWSARAGGITLACLTNSSLLGESSKRKLLFLGLSQIITSFCLLAIPFIRNYFLLVTLFTVMTFGSGSFDIADNSLMNQMLGPTTSRPLVQSLHACVAIGFVLVALLMPHFLPETKSTSDEICTRLKNPNDQNHTIEKEIEVSINDESVLVIPCLIFGIWLLLVGFGFVWHAFKGLNLPKHHAAQLVKSSEVVSGSPLPQESPFKHKIGLISLGVIFYFLTCGVDSYFQSQTYTVGLCGLSLSAQMAGWLNSLYFGCYLFGRLIGIPLSTVVSPDAILCSSLAGCLISSLFLVIFGLDAIILFICTGLMGFSTCFLFPSGITWLTKNIQDLKQVSFVFIGSNAANCVFPFLASHLFNEFGPESVFNLTCATEVASIICFLIMILVSRKLNK
eukprot:06502.XXX_221286_219158_1 [CDS] Oithona nana genome sequencing.